MRFTKALQKSFFKRTTGYQGKGTNKRLLFFSKKKHIYVEKVYKPPQYMSRSKGDKIRKGQLHWVHQSRHHESSASHSLSPSLLVRRVSSSAIMGSCIEKTLKTIQFLAMWRICTEILTDNSHDLDAYCHRIVILQQKKKSCNLLKSWNTVMKISAVVPYGMLYGNISFPEERPALPHTIFPPSSLFILCYIVGN